MKLKSTFKACIAGGAALLLTACNDQASHESAPAQSNPIHVKSTFSIPRTNTVIKEYTSDNAPGKIFTVVAGGLGVAIISNPVADGIALHDNSIHVKSSGEVSGFNATVVEYTSDNVPDTLFSVVMGGTTVSIAETPLVPGP